MRGRFGLLSRRRTSGLALALTLALLNTTGWTAASLASEDFGRWERSTGSCRVGRLRPAGPGERALSCRTLRLDQQLPGLLSVRFVVPIEGSRFASHQLVFAGVLLRSSAAMRCAQGRCEPRWPMRLQVSAVATAGFDGRGVATGLPQAQLARGNCRLDERSASCEARSRDGETWQGDASW